MLTGRAGGLCGPPGGAGGPRTPGAVRGAGLWIAPDANPNTKSHAKLTQACVVIAHLLLFLFWAPESYENARALSRAIDEYKVTGWRRYLSRFRN